MSYTHLTIIERTKIEVYLSFGYSIRLMAHLLDRHPSSISREIKRLSHYEAYTAQAHYRKEQNCLRGPYEINISTETIN